MNTVGANTGLILCCGLIILAIVPSSITASNLDPQAAAQYRLLIKKSERRLYLYQLDNGREKLLKTYAIALGNNPTGHKRQEGDGATPEGDYYLTHKNAQSKFYLSLGLSYPNTHDADQGLRQGLISTDERDAIASAVRRQEKPPQKTRLGGDIFIHGGGIVRDWTQGCVALENEAIKELFELLPVRTPVKIVS